MTEQNDPLDQNQKITTNEDLNKETDAAKEIVEELRKKNIEIVRALHPQKVLTYKQQEILLSIKEEELTDADKTRIAWATLRVKHHKYSGTDYSKSELKKVKAKRRLSKKSRKANR